ncbi:uncharacterized protein BDW47DRAFT_132454 [Aspergillus candidus]|uniref:Uncharacterized protein n=1 Tax=Aspergillus candidus TaxID=41067 RepID=A0A2I2F8V1_ASPCN|nr:hypothetical protein BDW47DRAFT_132454 [Aspergillus candidus]PLB37064.1 hypothetical protein BDW47DRAFT_132454 [Aspergillus candidus]
MSPRVEVRSNTGTLPHTTTLPMIEIYTAPSVCSSSWTYEPPEANNVSEGLLLQNAAPSDDTNNDCMPTGWGNRGRVPPQQIYSPGYCPHGYTSADVAIQPPVTTAICCPSDYEYTTNPANTQMGCTSMFPEGETTTVKVRQANNKRTRIVGPITMYAQPIIVAQEKHDLTMFVTSTDPEPSSTAAAPTSTTAVPTETDTPTGPTGIHDHVAGGEKPETSGMSTGSAIGVGVGVGVGGLALLLVLGLFILRRKKQSKRKQEIDFYSQTEGRREAGPLPDKPKPTGRVGPSELATNPHGAGTAIHEIGS